MKVQLKELLALTPREAVKQLVLAAARPGLTADQLELTQVQPSRERLVQVWVQVNRRGVPVHQWRYDGGAPYTYPRLHWSEVFGAEVVLPRPVPARVSDLLPALARLGNVTFDESDVVDHALHVRHDGSYVLLANPHSWRWYGQLTIRFADVPGTTAPVVASPANLLEVVQVVDPTQRGFGEELRALRRGTQLSAPGRVWWRWLNAACATPNRWVIDTSTPGPYNGGRARIHSNQRVANDEPLPLVMARPARKLIVSLDRRLCTTPTAVVTVYYSEPETAHA